MSLVPDQILADDAVSYVPLSAGRLAARICGPEQGPLVVCLPGLSANLHSFDVIAAALAVNGHRVIAVDLRGRGRSEITGPGSYGWPAHARDVLELVDAFGGGRIDVLGHSMGGYIGMHLAASEPNRVRRLVLIDIVRRAQTGSLPAVMRSLERLGSVHPSAESYLDTVRTAGLITPWHEQWDRSFVWELEPAPDGVRVRTDPAAITEDATWGTSHDPATFWPQLAGPVLLIRASAAMLTGTSPIVADEELDRFTATVAAAEVIEVMSNHLTVMTDPQAVTAICGFLEASLREHTGGPRR